MTEKIPCRYCGERLPPRKLSRHEMECEKDQKVGAAGDKPKTLPRGCMIRVCPKCGAQTGVFVLDGAKCQGCGSDL